MMSVCIDTLLLCSELDGVSEQWREIGTFLKLDEKQLKEMESSQGSVPQQCLREVITMWLAREQPSPSWSAIIEAMEFLGHVDLVLRLREKAFD